MRVTGRAWVSQSHVSMNVGLPYQGSRRVPSFGVPNWHMYCGVGLGSDQTFEGRLIGV